MFALSTLIFQSTLPIQGETLTFLDNNPVLSISIHSPYTGRDIDSVAKKEKVGYFNPLSLYRERQCFKVVFGIA